MALKESFETFDGTGFTAFGTTWRFETFTTTSAYSITDVALYGWRFGSCGTVTISIRAVDGGTGKPTGPDLAIGTIAQGDISALPSLTWVICTFAASYALDDATQYAIVWRAPSGDGSNSYTPFGYGSSGYAGGGSGTSTNSGSSWGAVSTTNDANFRVYGELTPPGKAQNPTPTDDQEGIKITGIDQLKLLQWEAPA